MAQQGHYTAAIELFSEAVKLDTRDFRFVSLRNKNTIIIKIRLIIDSPVILAEKWQNLKLIATELFLSPFDEIRCA